MNDLAFERKLGDANLRQEADASARRERAAILQRFLSQSAQALLGRGRADNPGQFCAACG
jgi:hypothetical protein